MEKQSQDSAVQNDQEVSVDEQVESKEDIQDQSMIIAHLQEEIAQGQDKLLRQLAETENIRSRSAKMVEEASNYAIFSFAKDLVSVMDNLDRALEHVPKDVNEEVKNIIEGVKMTQQELTSIFAKHSLESLKPNSGEVFDYNQHHAISQVATDDYEPGVIVNTMQVGYKIKDRLIRPAAVAVAKGK